MKTMMRTLQVSILSLLSLTSVMAADVPRQSPEFVLNLNGGKQDLLSHYRGKVMLVEFLFTTCPHCQHTAQTLNKLQAEFGARGFQAMGIAFNEMSSMLVPDFVRDYNVKFPVAWAQREQVMGYLQISTMERFVVPQIVLIDRKGQIRAQSPPLGDPKLQDEANLRVQIDALLKEAGGTASSAAAKPAAATAAKKK